MLVVTPARFLETRQPSWTRLETLVATAGRRGAFALTEAELHELTRLYPSVAVDVARARLYGLDAKTLQRINRLAIAAHGMLYRRPSRRPLAATWRFFSQDYPVLFRRLWPYVALSVSLFIIAGLGSYVCVLARPATAYAFVPAGLDVPDGGSDVSERDISERFRQIPHPPLAAGVLSNNISVAFMAFALGITAGIGTCWVVLVNAAMLGAFAAHFANHGLSYPLLCFILPHGLLEIMAILIAAAAGFRLGLSLAIPGALTRKASLRAGAAQAALLVAGTIPMFCVAGMIEGFVTPSGLPGGVKIAIGLSAGGLALLYLLLAGRGEPRSPSESVLPRFTTGAWT